MATPWSTVLARAKARYGLDRSTADAVHPDTFFLDRLNEILQEGGELGAFREEFTLNLPTTAAVTISSRIIRIIEGTLRIDYDGSGDYSLEPTFIDEATLRSVYGPVEHDDASEPLYYYLQRGSAADDSLRLILEPRSDTARTNGIKFQAQVYPTAVALTTDNLPLQVGEERFLIPGLCLAIAQAEANAGRPDAPIALWASEHAAAMQDWRDRIENSLRGRTRQVHYIPW